MLTSIFTSASLTLSALLASGFAAPSEINTQILKDLHIHTAECGRQLPTPKGTGLQKP